MNSGDAVGPYVIHSSLGSGGMGKVYRARDTRLGRDVALKQLSDRALTTDGARRKVLQEARAAAALSHPNIATIFDVLDTPDGPTIVMEYVPGESLARHIARGALPVERSLEIATQICEGLADAHARGIIHRDLKPANIQITPDGKAKILDFGIARLTAPDPDLTMTTPVPAHTEAGLLVGTPGYMAPEQLEGGRGDERADIYGVGVLLYEMLTGRKPYAGADVLSNALAVIRGGAPSVADLVPETPVNVSALVERAMAKDPGHRFQTARELSQELQRARGLGTGESINTPAPMGRQKMSRLLALGAIAAVILAVAGSAWVRNTNAPPVTARRAVFAVLPFKNSTGEQANDPIAVGLTDAVSNRLSSVQSLRVLSLDQTRQASGSAPAARDARAAANALGAQFVLDGELRRSGQTLDIDVTLVDGDGKRRAVGRYTGDIAQVIDLHQRIAQGVLAALRAADAVSGPASPSKGPTSNQPALAEYAQARVFLERTDNPVNIDHAIRLFQSAIGKDNRFALAHAGLGQAFWAKYRQTGDPLWTTKATTAILDALAIDPNQPEVRLSLGVIHQGLGRLDEAEKEFRNVAALQPGNDDAYRMLAGVYIDRGQWDAAVAELGRAIEFRPGYWRNHSELGFAHYRAGRFDAAAEAYKRVIELQPDSRRGYHMLGTVYQSAGRVDDALENYAKANAVSEAAASYSNIGTIHYWAGRYAKAADAYQRAIELAPNEALIHANLGDALRKLGKPDRARASHRNAVAEVRKRLAVNEKDAVNLSLLAISLAKLEDRAGADAAAAQALALNPDDGQVVYQAAMVDALARRQVEACAKLTKAVALGKSAEIVRRDDEFRILKGCDAYDRIVARR